MTVAKIVATALKGVLRTEDLSVLRHQYTVLEVTTQAQLTRSERAKHDSGLQELNTIKVALEDTLDRANRRGFDDVVIEKINKLIDLLNAVR